jgi:ribosomal protein L37E
MQDTVREIETRQEFWRPAQEQLHATPASIPMCAKCGADYVIGSRFCHVCGAGRDERARSSATAVNEKLGRVLRLPEVLNLSVVSTILFALGTFCAIAGIAVGFIYSAQTLVDWQAVQVWRIEWMLGSLIAFVAAQLLKSSGTATPLS